MAVTSENELDLDRGCSLLTGEVTLSDWWEVFASRSNSMRRERRRLALFTAPLALLVLDVGVRGCLLEASESVFDLSEDVKGALRSATMPDFGVDAVDLTKPAERVSSCARVARINSS